ncbi:hypothetical protein FKP32DRAFT_1379134 [Trametes sanguinea]|nr:hypothetical protein FKP32DRAFT_1379134 [Trametes sanguinea]
MPYKPLGTECLRTPSFVHPCFSHYTPVTCTCAGNMMVTAQLARSTSDYFRAFAWQTGAPCYATASNSRAADERYFWALDNYSQFVVLSKTAKTFGPNVKSIPNIHAHMSYPAALTGVLYEYNISSTRQTADHRKKRSTATRWGGIIPDHTVPPRTIAQGMPDEQSYGTIGFLWGSYFAFCATLPLANLTKSKPCTCASERRCGLPKR